jgi:hypothetical protein
MLSVILTLAVGGNILCVDAHDDKVMLSFDTIYPSTPYKDALGSCMQVLGYLDQLCHEHERGDQTVFCFVHDAFLGKVVLAQHRVAQLLENIESGALVADDNINYLSAILSYISKLYQERIVLEQRNTIALGMIDEMVDRVSRVTEQ